jgi:serine/threonine protein phosphatase 1
MSIFAIGDIHGHLMALDALLANIPASPDDTLVFLGDYVNKGPEVRGTLDRLYALNKTRKCIFLRGNHDQIMIDAHHKSSKMTIFESLGGEDTLMSYGSGLTEDVMRYIPEQHWEFLEHMCRNYYQTDDYIFVHGGIRPKVSPKKEKPERLLWTPLSRAAPHKSGKTVICGHSAQRNGRIADLGHTICIDTGIGKGSLLTCLELDTFRFWQSNPLGRVSNGTLSRVAVS